MRALVGIVALLALSAVAFFVVQTLPPRIESDLKQRSTDALNAAHLTFAQVTVAGRVVTLAGVAPSPTAKEEAVKVANAVWGVSSVHDMLAVSTDGQPEAPQTVVASADAPSDPATPAVAPSSATPPSEPAPSASPSSDSGVLPSVGSLVDPALAPTDEPASPAAEPAPSEQASAEPAPAPAAPSPAETAAAEPPPTAAPQPPAAETKPEPAVAAAPEPAPTPTPQPATPTPQPAPVQPPPPQTVAAATPPAPAPTPKPAPVTTPVAPISKESIAQGITEGLTTAMQALPPAVAAAPPSYRLEAHVEGKRVQLQGVVSTPSAQRALVAHVRRNIRRAQIVDSLQVAHTKPDKDWLGVARTGLAQLAHLDTGSLKLDGHKVAVSGKPKSERDRSRVLAAMGELPNGYTSTVLLERMQDATPTAPAAPSIAAAPQATAEPEDDDDDEEDEATPAPPQAKPHTRPAQPRRPAFVARREMREPRHVARRISSWCRRRFNDVLPRVAVAFASGSWRMQDSVGLGDLARVAEQCPDARIRITGHSDTQETSPAATGLSYRRATTVRAALVDRGVAGGNITVVGRGGMRPAFSNATIDGRENNRRVEFAVW